MAANVVRKYLIMAIILKDEQWGDCSFKEWIIKHKFIIIIKDFIYLQNLKSDNYLLNQKQFHHMINII